MEKKLEPAAVWKAFEAISAIPRCSGQEKAVMESIRTRADRLGLKWVSDKAGNLVVRKPASRGREGRPTVILQGHVDMVCEQNRGRGHDFSCQGIEWAAEGDWVRAKGTTLGADNGIAVAYMLALLEDPAAIHDPLECLFTVDEETGLTGALGLSPDLLEGRILINLDSEDEGRFTIGCAGGVTTKGSLDLEWVSPPRGRLPYTLGLRGLPGGHSGVEIGLGRINAVQALVRVLADLFTRFPEAALGSLEGGDKHNAIPREAFATVALAPAETLLAETLVQDWERLLRDEGGAEAASLTLVWEPAAAAAVMERRDRDRVLSLLSLIPHGVASLSREVPGLVESSSNLAAVRVTEGRLQVLTSQRSSRISLRDELSRKIAAAFSLAGGTADHADGYPAWTPRSDSPLLKKCLRLYRDLNGREAPVEVIHAGLECGVIGDRIPGMDMISFGPDIRGAHTPEERVSIGSVGRVWEFLLKLLGELE